MPAVQQVLNYNRALQTNFFMDTNVPLPLEVSVLLLELGLYAPAETTYLEVLATVGWQAVLTVEDSTDLQFFLTQDGASAGSALQQAPFDTITGVSEMISTIQWTLTPPGEGHHVYQLFAYNLGTPATTVVGPVSLTVKAIGSP